ncbi:AtpZ/AtpI family protein [Marivirga aurantiaca]|uniref:AtpZ/AtpI family protein n=1 Tax=Marivirga aurantiaca TaxID=2802615 RepID=UPI0021CE9739|nr:AtpZ/AtpI family protein [Marivirga aurantiaca]
MDKQPQNSKKQKQFNNYIKYSGLAFQMLGTIGLFVFIGYKLDEWFDKTTPVNLIIFSLLGIAISLYQIIREFV